MFVSWRTRLLQHWDVWFADCASLLAPLIFPNTKQVDNERLAIDWSALKQLIWDNRDDCDEDVDGSKGDYPRWIDTSAMLSDCLTKTMTSCLLNETLSTGTFDMRPTEQSLAIKATRKGSGVHRRKSRNGCKILTIDISRVCNVRRDCKAETRYHRDRFRSCEVAEYVGNVKSPQH